jgi:hypothetical protein
MRQIALCCGTANFMREPGIQQGDVIIQTQDVNRMRDLRTSSLRDTCSSDVFSAGHVLFGRVLCGTRALRTSSLRDTCSSDVFSAGHVLFGRVLCCFVQLVDDMHYPGQQIHNIKEGVARKRISTLDQAQSSEDGHLPHNVTRIFPLVPEV